LTEIKQVRIGGHKIGLVGLDEIFAEVRSREIASDAERAEALVELVSGKNYVPDARRGEYAGALLREFKIAGGEPVETVSGTGREGVLEVRVYGPGCANCERLAAEVMSALSDLHLKADFEHVKDMDEIVAIMPVGLPALAVNGRVVATGQVPSRRKIMELLMEATE
jgi:small redox-active disulfide protein 2